MLSVAKVIVTPAIETVIIYAIATAIGALLIWIGKSIATVAKNQSAIHDQVMGVPEVGYPSMRDQFDEIRAHLSRQDETLTKLEHEVQDNSGSSLKDAVKVINKDIANIRKEVVPGINKNFAALENLQNQFNDLDLKLEKHIIIASDKNN
jgi:hypothetical protein